MLAMLGEAKRRPSTAVKSSGTGMAAKLSAVTKACQGGSVARGWYTGPSLARGLAGTSATTIPLNSTLTMPLAVTCPISVPVSPHFAQVARTKGTCAGSTASSMRSWDSDSIIS